MSTSPAPVTAAPKVSFLKRVGQLVGKILGIIARDGAPIADKAALVVTTFLPQFATEIGMADSLIDNIAKQCIVTEALTSGVAQAVTGTDKLNAVVAGIGPEIDAWIAAKFPGATQVSAAKKAGLVSAIADIVNEQEGGAVTATSVPATAPAA